MKKTFSAILLMAVLSGCGQSENAVESQAPPQQQEPATATAPATVEVGAMMPSYAAEMLDGSTFDIAQERGNVVFLNLWANWCGTCRYEIPELEKLHKEHAPQRFKVVGVSVDEGGDQVVRDFVAEEKVSYPIVLDPQSKLAVILDTVILPTSVIVDRSGKVVWKKLGVVSTRDEEMIRALEQALRG